MNSSDIKRFWSKVEKSIECWMWTDWTNGGYGRFSVCSEGKQRKIYAHRASYELAHGAIPTGLQVDHTCFNRACVRPEHLRLASDKQNKENRSGACSNSKTGVRGVRAVAGGRYRAKVQDAGRTIEVGTFPSLREAEAAVISKRNELFTHNLLDRAAGVAVA